MQNTTELARLFYIQLDKIMQNEQLSERDKVEALYRLLQLVFSEATNHERLQFTTLFARMAYAFHIYDIPKRLQYFVHTFRRKALQRELKEEKAVYELGLQVVAKSIESLFDTKPAEALRTALPVKWSFPFIKPKIQAFKKRARVLALQDDEAKNQLVCRDEERPDDVIRVQYNIRDRNENFNQSIRELRLTFGFPVTLNLLDVELDADGIYRPAAFVVEPDFLMDVSAVAECFKASGTAPVLHLLKKYLPFQSTKHTMLGHIANFFLDELMTDPSATFNATFPKVFRLNPLAWSVMEEAEVREIFNKSKFHWATLKRMVVQDFAAQDISPEKCLLEPTFYSERYGLQGRLDVFLLDKKKSAIVELKSGKAFMPNRYKISHNHYTQTLLYDLMVRSVFQDEVEPVNYILYSGEQQDNLRFAPRLKSQQYEALQLRNQLVALEWRLSKLVSEKPIQSEQYQPVGQTEGNIFFNKLQPGRYPKIMGFNRRDLELFEGVWSGMSDLEKAYMTEFSGFIAREQQLAKTGRQGSIDINGMASLWLDTPGEKDEKFELLSYLTITEEKTKEDEPIIRFARTEKTNPLANYRRGDIAVLHPLERDDQTVLDSQIFKCSIISISSEEVTVCLRCKQFNTTIFGAHEFWCLEHDMMDSGYTSMYRGLFEMMGKSGRKRGVLLTTLAPAAPSTLPEEIPEIIAPDTLTEEQQRIFKKAILARDYFLLWGPPGTGKTSQMLRHMVKWLMENTDENILLLAYTNRAVDEICEAISEGEPFLRIGSRYSTDPRYRDRLLSVQMELITKRKELRQIIEGHRVFVGTVAGFASKKDLLKIKQFQRVIIDEASQILEPNLVGLLPHFERFMLIGDHQQLPAVVVQSQTSSKTQHPDLQRIGLHNLRNSLFERLYLRCQEEGWDWAYDQLSHQGRMHQDIMAFPNEVFYGGNLKILPKKIAHSKTQSAKIKYKLPKEFSKLEKLITKHRISFLPTPIDEENANPKTNIHEAKWIAKLVTIFQKTYQASGKELNAKSIGIITPYRAQIAQIKEVIAQQDIDSDLLTVDTVERYQGGAREVILISLCTNSISQLASLVSRSEEGVDRKLNVALTRAREHVILLGNEDILRQDEVYRELMERVTRLEV